MALTILGEQHLELERFEHGSVMRTINGMTGGGYKKKNQWLDIGADEVESALVRLQGKGEVDMRAEKSVHEWPSFALVGENA